MPRRNTSVLPEPVTPNSSSGAGRAPRWRAPGAPRPRPARRSAADPVPVTAGAGTASETTIRSRACSRRSTSAPAPVAARSAGSGSGPAASAASTAACRVPRGSPGSVERRPERPPRRRRRRQHELQRPGGRRRVASGDLERQLDEVGRDPQAGVPHRLQHPVATLGRPHHHAADGARPERCVDDRTDLEHRIRQVVEGPRERTGLDEGDDGDRAARGPNRIPLPSGHGPPTPIAPCARCSRRARGAAAPRRGPWP